VSLSRFWLFLAVALPVLAALLAPMATVDLTYQLRAGAEILANGAIPTTDTWTFTAAGLPWVDQQWGAQLAFAVVERLGGWTGLALLRAAATGVVVGAVVVIARRRGLEPRLAALLALGAFVVAAPAMALRPQLLGMACFAAVLVLVADRRAHPRGLWLVPVIVAAWANLHGSFFLGPLVVGLAWLEDVHDRVATRHRTLAVAVVAAVAACVTPFGPGVWTYAVGLSVNPAVSARVSEWQPTSLRSVPGLLFFASALAMVALLARRGRTVGWPALAWLATFFVIGAVAQRGLAWWPIAAAVAATGILGAAAGAPQARGASAGPAPALARPDLPAIRRVNVVVAVILVLAGVALLPAWRPIAAGTRAPAGLLTHAPAGVTAALRDAARPGDRVFNPQAWGSWFEYALPDLRVAVDSRIEVFPLETWAGYARVLSGADGWQAQLTAWDVAFVVLAGPDTTAQGRFEAAGWQVVHADADGVVLRRP
jgi:hypothetical protein